MIVLPLRTYRHSEITDMAENVNSKNEKFLEELRKDEQDAIKEAYREAMRLDDDEDTLTYKGRLGD